MRHPDWWPQLLSFIEEHRSTPRQYGVWDCWQFTGGGVLAMTGIDYRERFPTYTTLEEGIRILADNGGADSMMTGLFGPPKPVAFAQRGYIVVADLGDGPAGGICLGVKSKTVGPDGLDDFDTLSGVAAWCPWTD